MAANANGTAAHSAAVPMRERVTFATNVPVRLKLDHDDGQPSPGRYGDQYMYTFNSGTHIAWLDPAVRELILRCGARAGDEIHIAKLERREGNRRRVEWEVAKIEDEPPAARDQAAQPAAPPAPQQAQAEPAKTTPAPAAQEPDNTAQPTTSVRLAAALTEALTAAIDAARAAEAHAAAIGMPLRWQPEDIRAMAATLYIQEARR